MKRILSILICLLLLCACTAPPDPAEPEAQEQGIIGVWRGSCSLLGYAAMTEEPYEIAVNIGYENAGSELHEIPNSPRRLDFSYVCEGGTLTVWQGLTATEYAVSLTEDTMELTPENGSAFTLTRISDRPLGMR